MKGPDTDSLGKILQGVLSAKFGPGAIGRVGTIAMAAMVVLAVPILALAFVAPYVALVGLLLIGGIAIYTLSWCFRYAEMNPVVAALDGSQITKILHQQATMRPLEGIPPPPAIVDSLTQNPTLEDTEGEG